MVVLPSAKVESAFATANKRTPTPTVSTNRIASSIVISNMFIIVFTIIFPLILYWIQNRNIKKIYNSNKVVQNLDVIYEFYDTYFVEKSEHGEMKIEYSKFDEIFETKTNFYLMIAKNQGYMLPKSDMPSELEEFIRNIKL